MRESRASDIGSAAGALIPHPQLQWLRDSPQTLIPVVETPDCFEIMVAGGMGGRSTYSYGAGEPVSRVIEQSAIKASGSDH